MRTFISIFIVVGCMLLTSCATSQGGLADLDRQYEQYIADNELAPADTVQAFRFWSWSDLSEQYLVISTRVREPYLVKLKSRCHDLMFAQSIRVNNTGLTLRSKFDSISVIGSQLPPCLIKQIYPITREQMDELVAIR